MYKKPKYLYTLYQEDTNSTPDIINVFTISGTGKDTCQLNFDEPFSSVPISHYEVHLDGTFLKDIYGTGEILTNLTGGTTYMIKVRAINTNMYAATNWSNEISFTTL